MFCCLPLVASNWVVGGGGNAIITPTGVDDQVICRDGTGVNLQDCASTFTVDGTNILIQSGTDSVTGLQVLDADGGVPILNIDTTNERVGIGTAAPNENFDVVGSMAITNGIRFDSSAITGRFQIGEDATANGFFIFDATGGNTGYLFTVDESTNAVAIGSDITLATRTDTDTLLVQNATLVTGDTSVVNRAGVAESGTLGEWQDNDANPLTTIDGIATLGDEGLTDTGFPNGANWANVGDFAVPAGTAVYTHAAGSGTLTQTEAQLALTPALANVRYSLTYTVSSPTGDAACTITTAFALTAVDLDETTGTNTSFFTSAAAPGNFILSCTSTSGGITFDDMLLMQVRGGDIETQGPFRMLVSPNEPVDCTEAIWGSMYFSTTDAVPCVCADDGATEWQQIQDMTTDCTI